MNTSIEVWINWLKNKRSPTDNTIMTKMVVSVAKDSGTIGNTVDRLKMRSAS